MDIINRLIIYYIFIGLITLILFILFIDKIRYLRANSNLHYVPNLIDFDIDNMSVFQIVMLTLSFFTVFWPTVIYFIYEDYKNQRK